MEMQEPNNNAVGIVTLPGRFNYGNRLQAYASTAIYRKLGFSPILLNPTMGLSIKRRMKLLTLRLLGRKLSSPESGMSDGRKSSFDRFEKSLKSHNVRSYRDEALLDFSLFSVGSDQVWNPQFMGDKDKWYFLSFVPLRKRIALSPSIGLDALKHSYSRRIAKGVANFRFISVREKRGAELIRECSGRTAEVICDPTLVLSPEEWRVVADSRLTPREPYIFTYLLGGVGESAARVLDEVTDRGRLPVVPLSDQQKPEEPEAGPAEFISLIDNAVHVVTDSFHAAVFSSILQTPLTIVRREGGASMFSRLESLTQMLGIEHKVYDSPDFDISHADDYEGVPEAIKRERKKFMSYLEGCLDAQLPGWREAKDA